MNKNTVIAMVLSGLVIAAAMFVQYKFFSPCPRTATAVYHRLCNGATGSSPAKYFRSGKYACRFSCAGSP